MDQAADRLAPWNETEQTLTVQSISVFDDNGNIVLAPAGVATATHVNGPAGWTLAGTVTPTVDTLTGEVTEVVFQPAEDYNENNPTVGGNPSTANFVYTVTDDGMTTLPDGNLAVPQPAPETVDATVSIRVLPMNDPPSTNGPVTIPSPALGTPMEDSDFVIDSQVFGRLGSAGGVPGNDEDNPLTEDCRSSLSKD